jgi:hypothetical protein
MPPAALATDNVFDGDGIPSTSATRPIMLAGPIGRHRSALSVSVSRTYGLAAGWACALPRAKVARTARQRGSRAAVRPQRAISGTERGIGSRSGRKGRRHDRTSLRSIYVGGVADRGGNPPVPRPAVPPPPILTGRMRSGTGASSRR